MILPVLTFLLCCILICANGTSAVLMIFAVLSAALLMLQSLHFLKLSRTDPLTGLYNLRHLRAMSRRYRRRNRLWVYYLDVDHLKSVNDTDGHSAGDRLLSDTAAALKQAAHRRGEAYRIGGDEFLLILRSPITAAQETAIFACLPATYGAAQGAGYTLSELMRHAERELYGKRTSTHSRKA